MLSQQQFMSVREAAAVSGLSQATIRSWIKSNRVPAYGAGRLVRVKIADILQPRSHQPTDAQRINIRKAVERRRIILATHKTA